MEILQLLEGKYGEHIFWKNVVDSGQFKQSVPRSDRKNSLKPFPPMRKAGKMGHIVPI